MSNFNQTLYAAAKVLVIYSIMKFIPNLSIRFSVILSEETDGQRDFNTCSADKETRPVILVVVMIMMMMMMMIIIIIIIIQKTAMLGTAHILRKVLTQSYNGVNAGTSNICTMNSYIRIAATQCSLGKWFFSGI